MAFCAGELLLRLLSAACAVSSALLRGGEFVARYRAALSPARRGGRSPPWRAPDRPAPTSPAPGAGDTGEILRHLLPGEKQIGFRLLDRELHIRRIDHGQHLARWT